MDRLEHWDRKGLLEHKVQEENQVQLDQQDQLGIEEPKVQWEEKDHQVH